MALSFKVGSFALNTGTGNQSDTSVGFQPKALIFFLTNLTADGFAADKVLGVGLAVSSSQRGAVANYFDDTSFSSGRRADDTECILSSVVNGTLEASADFVSMDASGFTINVTDAPASAYIVNYLALGGADLTNAVVGNVTLNTSTGNQAVTGLGFRPDCILFLSSGQAGTFPLANDSNHLALGAAISSTSRATAATHDNNTNPTQSESMQVATRCLVGSAGGTIDHELNFVSFDSDGFTLNVVDAPASAVKVFYLALKGGRFKIGVETQKTSTGTKATTGVGFQPRGLFLFGVNAASSTSLSTSNDRFSVGAGDGTNEGTIWGQSTDNVSVTDENSRLSRTKVFQHCSNPSTVDAEADLSSLDADGFTLNWSTADATAREFAYVAFGDTAAAGGGGGHTHLLTLGAG